MAEALESLENRVAGEFIGELGGGEVAEFIDQALDTRIVHNLGAGFPFIA